MGYARTGALSLLQTSTTNPTGSGSSAPVAVSAQGGTITYSGGYTIHTFTTSGTFTVTSGSKSDIEYLVVAGGGGGSDGGSTNVGGSGGGAGGFIESYAGQVFGSDFSGPKILVNAGDVFTVTVGAGGTKITSGSAATSAANKGVNSSIVGSTYSAIALGGGSAMGSAYYSYGQYANGGSGGGQNNLGSNYPYPAPGIAVATPRQGYDGGDFTASGGGGAGSRGKNGQDLGANSGGDGRTSSISGTAVTYAKGGPGSFNTSTAPVAAPANSGQGGGAGTSFSGGALGLNGGSGIVIIRYPTAATNPLFFAATGGTVTTSGNYKIHTFTSSGVFTPTNIPSGATVEMLIVAGGAGGCGGGGGAGGVLYYSRIYISASCSITVGGGGAGALYSVSGSTAPGGQGSSTIVSNSDITLTAAGGGGAQGSYNLPSQPSGGGSGGGATISSTTAYTRQGGLGTPGQGNNGGQASCAGTGAYAGWGGGGGAGAAGGAGYGAASTNVGTYGGNGGDGLQYSISGTSTYYGGGGGGGAYGTAGNGGAGGGGGGGNGLPAGTGTGGSGGSNGGQAGAANRAVNSGNGGNGGTTSGGGGGGSAYNTFSTGGSGGSGIVIIRYLYQ